MLHALCTQWLTNCAARAVRHQISLLTHESAVASVIVTDFLEAFELTAEAFDDICSKEAGFRQQLADCAASRRHANTTREFEPVRSGSVFDSNSSAGVGAAVGGGVEPGAPGSNLRQMVATMKKKPSRQESQPSLLSLMPQTSLLSQSQPQAQPPSALQSIPSMQLLTVVDSAQCQTSRKAPGWNCLSKATSAALDRARESSGAVLQVLLGGATSQQAGEPSTSTPSTSTQCSSSFPTGIPRVQCSSSFPNGKAARPAEHVSRQIEMASGNV
jgi:hypothetical protein